MLTSFLIKHITFAKKLMGQAWSLLCIKFTFIQAGSLWREKNIRWMHSKVYLLNCQANIFKFSLQILCNFFLTFHYILSWQVTLGSKFIAWHVLHCRAFEQGDLSKAKLTHLFSVLFFFVCLHCRKKLWREILSRKIKIPARSRLILYLCL